jgi:hypothetical protein
MKVPISKSVRHALLSAYEGGECLTGGEHVSGESTGDRLVDKWIIILHKILD